MIDVVLAGGEVMDGSGGGAFRADVGIHDGRIACIGDPSGQESAERVELNGLSVCPAPVFGKNLSPAADTLPLTALTELRTRRLIIRTITASTQAKGLVAIKAKRWTYPVFVDS